jgi:hypothetical protein
MKRDAKLIFGDSGVEVDWSASATGIDLVAQKLVNNMMTDIGTDEIVPTRGTRLLRAVTGGGVYDLRSAQHALNFAALAARRNVRNYETDDMLPEERVGDFSVLLEGVVDRKVVTQLTISNAAGTSIGIDQQLL